MKKQLYPLQGFCARVSLSVLLLLFTFTGFTQTYSFDFGAETPPAPGSLDANHQDLDEGNPIPIEVGVRFRVTQPGVINAIRFFKGNSDQGSHVGNLWLADGTNIGTVNFTGETGAGGWKQQAFATPIPVVPGTEYVASYYSDDGWYALLGGFFGPAELGSDPLIMLANTGIGNGLYRYTAGSAFPDQTFNGSNYWVDVVFTPTFTLPVHIFSITATPNEKNVVLNWKTSTESNNKGFEVQRSNNGSDWYTLSFVDGVGESTTIQNYNFTDKSLAPGVYFYRVRQIDFDGKPTNSTVVTARISGQGAVTLYQNYPNPVKGSSVIRFDLPTSQRVRLSITNLSGREVKVLMNKVGEAGTHQVNLDAAGLGRQLYIIRLQTDNELLTKKMLVQ